MSAGGKYPDRFELAYVQDRNGVIWRVVRDGGMVTTVGYDGQIYSAGIQWLKESYGPLVDIAVPDAPVVPPVWTPEKVEEFLNEPDLL